MHSKILFTNLMATSLMIIMAIYFDVTFADSSNEFKSVDLRDATFRKILKQIEPQITEKLNSTNVYLLETPISVQMKSGSKTSYKTTIIIGETDCKKDKNQQIDQCQLNGKSHSECKAEIDSNDGQKNSYKLTKLNCKKMT
ncbi:hypothetical protein DERP_002682 [Dermatophagoides pteronyssinus]|uniref:Uncharacterized protein n=1 Tax=Dermatophagoides pteronyssinus TaxID=6956 RepID=A0ABQ8JVE1_DERPT|nr:hypothetical protein DERP_002682 [Dermatophagoides pteronyssinus]